MSTSATLEDGPNELGGTDAVNEPSDIEERMTAPGYAGP